MLNAVAFSEVLIFFFYNKNARLLLILIILQPETDDLSYKLQTDPLLPLLDIYDISVFFSYYQFDVEYHFLVS